MTFPNVRVVDLCRDKVDCFLSLTNAKNMLSLSVILSEDCSYLLVMKKLQKHEVEWLITFMLIIHLNALLLMIWLINF